MHTLALLQVAATPDWVGPTIADLARRHRRSASSARRPPLVFAALRIAAETKKVSAHDRGAAGRRRPGARGGAPPRPSRART